MPEQPRLVEAEPTIDRLERFYALIHDVEEAARVDVPAPAAAPAPADEGESLAGESLAAVAEAFERRPGGGATLPLVLDPQRVVHELFGQRRYREVVPIVLTREDGTELTDEEAGRVRPSVVGAAIVPFSRELTLAWTTLSGGVSDGGSAQPTAPTAGIA